jgi:hypothetical protein
VRKAAAIPAAGIGKLGTVQTPTVIAGSATLQRHGSVPGLRSAVLRPDRQTRILPFPQSALHLHMNGPVWRNVTV